MFILGDVPGRPWAEIPGLPMQGAWVLSLVRELDPACHSWDLVQPNKLIQYIKLKKTPHFLFCLIKKTRTSQAPESIVCPWHCAYRACWDGHSKDSVLWMQACRARSAALGALPTPAQPGPHSPLSLPASIEPSLLQRRGLLPPWPFHRCINPSNLQGRLESPAHVISRDISISTGN